jgi:hypothetical protein
VLVLRKESASFLKKRSKKLLLLRALAGARQCPQGPKVFWLLFFKKVTSSLNFL